MFNVARRSHRKVRTGCRTCKRRKIKCDEGRPSCWNCIKHSVTCDFLPAPATPKSQGYATPSPQTNPRFVSDTGLWAAPSNAFPIDLSENGDLPELNILDLELLHHFAISTSLSMTADTVVRTLWRTKIPQIGFQHKFLMRGMLAISALHLSHLHPAKRDFYFPYSMKHHQMALREGTAALSNVTMENCAALHIFSILTCMHTVGRPRKPEDFPVVGDSGIAKWMVLFRGSQEIIEPFLEPISTGPLAALFQSRLRRQRLRETAMIEPQASHLDELHRLVLQSTTDPHLAHLYTDSIDSLQNSFTFIYNSAPHTYETGDVFVWMFRASEEYLGLLQNGDQAALAIFAYSCVLFKKLESYWWIEGWSWQLMANIWMHLDEEHRLWIQWPIEEIGWSPG